MEKDDRTKYLSIKEISHMCNVPTQTVRYYDTIGIFKADYVDPETKYRYYNPERYEMLDTILELRQLDFSLDEIRDYFKERNIKKSADLLYTHYFAMTKEIEQKQKLANLVKEKLDFINRISDGEIQEFEYEIKDRPERRAIVYFEGNSSDVPYNIMHLERHLKGSAPILASDRIGFYSLIRENEGITLLDMDNWKSMILCDEQLKDSKHYRVIPAGKYLTFYVRDYTKDRNIFIKKALDYAKTNRINICGTMIQSFKVDVTITDKNEETVVEIELQIKE